MEYLPFGETLVDEHLNSNNSPFKFNGKEMDEETSNYYYGARYYDPKFSIFISVDPLADKYPGISSYAYCFNNPINLIDPTGMSAEEPPVNGLEWFSDDTGEYFWNNEKGSYEHYADSDGDGSSTFQGYYSADKFSEPVGNYNVIFDLSNVKPKDEFDSSKTITALSDPLMKYLEKRGEVKDISDPDKYPGVKIYSSEYMNGALTAGNVIFTNPDMERPVDLDHEYGHYLDYKFHFKYDKIAYAKTIAGPSFISATASTLSEYLPKSMRYDHEQSESEKRANRLGGAWTGNTELKNKFRK